MQQAGSHYWAYTKGFWNGAVGLVTFAKDVVVKADQVAQYLDPLEQLNKLLSAGYKSYYNGELTEAQWKKSLANNLKNEHLKDIARILGIDVKNLSPEGVQRLKEIFAEAYEITAFIADDKESIDMLTQFGKDYAGAQSSIEWAEFAGGGVFEIVLTALLLAFTGGVGNVAQAASKIRHAGKLRSLGSIFRKLGKLLKRKRLRKKVRVSVDTKKSVKTELPEAKKTHSSPSKKDSDNQNKKPIKKPKYAPDIKKWEKKGGKAAENSDGSVTYTDWEGNSVTYKNDAPDFSEHSLKNVEIEMQGDHYHDYKAANKAAGYGDGPYDHPENTTWHHHEDMKTMQNIDSAIHSRFTHKGGVSGLK